MSSGASQFLPRSSDSAELRRCVGGLALAFSRTVQVDSTHWQALEDLRAQVRDMTKEIASLRVRFAALAAGIGVASGASASVITKLMGG